MKEALTEVAKRGQLHACVIGRRPLAKPVRPPKIAAWFAAIMPNLVAVTWVGRDNYETIGKKATGGRVALPAFESFLNAAKPPLMAFPPQPES